MFYEKEEEEEEEGEMSGGVTDMAASGGAVEGMMTFRMQDVEIE